jgi:K+-transporting ATPase c subunit
MRDRHAPHRSLMGASENLPCDLLRWLASSCRGCRQNKSTLANQCKEEGKNLKSLCLPTIAETYIPIRLAIARAIGLSNRILPSTAAKQMQSVPGATVGQ